MNTTQVKSFIFIALAGLLVLSSCAPRVPFTQAVREKYKIGEEDLKRIQFYASNDIVMVRGQVSEKEKETTDGTFTVKSGQQVEEVVIKAGTPGVVTELIDGNTLAVSFELDDAEGLVFADKSQKKGPYYMQTLPWKNNKRQVKYKQEMYSTSAQSNHVYLMFKMKQIRSFKRDQRVVKGRKL